MTKATKIVLGVVVGLIVTCIVVAVTLVFLVRSAFQTQQASAGEATTAFEEVRAQFKGVQPVFAFDTAGPRVVRMPPATKPETLPTSVHILAFEESEGRIARVRIPFSILKLSGDPIEFNGVTLEMEDVQQYGRTLLIDGDTPEGDPILIWTD